MPSVRGQVNHLSNLRSQCEVVLGLTIGISRLVIEHEEAGLVPVLHIEAELGVCRILPVVVEGHEENSIVPLNKASIFPGTFHAVPKGARIGPVSKVLFFAPRILHLDQLGAI